MSLPGMTPFLEACGATGPLVITYPSPEDAERVSCVHHQPFAIIGRESPSDVILNDAAVSARHAYLQILDGRAFVLDLGSRTGLSWDGSRGKAGWLNPRQRLGIGPHWISVNDGCLPKSDDFNPLITGVAERPDLPAVGLTFTKGVIYRGIWAMTCRLALVGRSVHCKVRLTSSSVSRYHCCFMRMPGGLWVVCLSSRCGMTVNGRVVRYAQLHTGDRVGVGRFEIEVVSAQCPSSGTNTMIGTAFSPPVPRPSQLITVADGATNVESGAIAPAADALPASLLRQFAAMHSHMLDQFQQAMVRMVQVFGQMRREQMADVQTELKELREVNRELQELRAQMATSPQPASAPPLGVATEATSEDAAMESALSEMEKAVATFSDHDGSEGSKHAALTTLTQDQGAERRGAVPLVPRIEPSPAPTLPKTPADGVPAPAVPPSPAAPAPVSPASLAEHADLQAKLFQRMTTLQEERQSRWRKILGLLNAKGSDR
jgi:pSer/pThr/pTyr-binding forkhead associated (FHA) protein